MVIWFWCDSFMPLVKMILNHGETAAKMFLWPWKMRMFSFSCSSRRQVMVCSETRSSSITLNDMSEKSCESMYCENGDAVMISVDVADVMLFTSDLRIVILTDKETWSRLKNGVMLLSVPNESSPHFVFSILKKLFFLAESFFFLQKGLLLFYFLWTKQVVTLFCFFD